MDKCTQLIYSSKEHDLSIKLATFLNDTDRTTDENKLLNTNAMKFNVQVNNVSPIH